MDESIERLAARCVMPGFTGMVAPEWVKRRGSEGLGGVVVYGRNVGSPDQLAALTSSLHAERPELLIAIDEEGGDVTRLESREGSSYPGNLALGVTGDLDLTRMVAASMGAELSAAGIDLDFAPVVDVNSNPDNPIIGVRSFGSDPAVVAAHAVAWIEGLQGAGVAACAKHFPGHGDTSVDSHVALPVVTEDPHAGALEPFRAAIAVGVRAVMSAHLLVPALDGRPATVSRRVMTDLLRVELGFRGIAVTDGLEMRGLSELNGLPESAVQALVAGCDALCVGGGLEDEDIVDEICQAVGRAVAEGRLSQERLVEAASRVDALAAWRKVQAAPAHADRASGLEAARRAVRSEGSVRIRGDAVIATLVPEWSIAAGEIAWGVSGPLTRHGARVTSLEFNGPPVDVESILSRASGRTLVLVVRDVHRHPWQAETAAALLMRRPDTVVVEMGLPVCRPDGAAAYIATYGASRVSGEAAAELLWH